jgi:uncharacterized protein (TIGR02680 family)
MSVTALPAHSAATEPGGPAAGRWRPSRAGILNVWRYYDETFEFHDGRLLLRGPNGTGKSKALELLLPYLLDASLRANRLSTFGTSERTMHWNLMGEGASGTTRVGYVWLEFASLAERGHWFTCGARLQASSHTSNVTVDYFTTEARVGGELTLMTDAGQPLTRPALTEAIGGAGTVYATATDYRHAVRQALFPDLSEGRYDALITALLQLRTPKLSQRLDPALLSTLLSRALPPLAGEDIAELAEGFERLDRQREQLARLDTEAEAAKSVASRQRSYAQRVLRASSAALISATTEMDNLTRAARESEESYQAARTEKEGTETRLAELARGLAQADAHIEGLTQRDAYTQGKQLDELRQQAARAGEASAERAAEAEARAAEAETGAAKAEQARVAAEQRNAAVRAAADEAAASARRVGMTSVASEIEGELARDGHNGRALLLGAVRGKQGQISEVRSALETHERAVAARTGAEDALEVARGEHARQEKHRAELAEAYEETLAAQRARLSDWAEECRELTFDVPEELAEHAESESAVSEYVRGVAEAWLQTVTTEETTLTARHDRATTERRELAEEIERLRRTVDLPPEPPPQRTADRAAMPGAPLWKLLAFADGVDAPTQAGIEAGMQASGLLDAWLTPSGELTGVGHDTFVAAALHEPAPGRCLAEVLRAEPDGAVPREHIERLLAAVAFDDSLPEGHQSAIGADGCWRLGTVTGSWEKPESAHIGAAARERHRQRRITEASAALGTRDGEIGTLATQLDLLAERRRAMAAERATMPPFEGVHAARRELDRAEAAVLTADGHVRRAAEELARREEEAGQALRALSLAGTTSGLPTDRAALAALEHAVGDFRETAETWLVEHGALAEALRWAEHRREQATRAEETAGQASAAAERAAAEAAALTEKLTAVESTVGVEYRQVLAELAEQRQERDRLARDHDAAGGALLELSTRIGSLQGRRQRDVEQRDFAVAARNTAAAKLRALVSGTFPADAGVELDAPGADGVKATLDAARAVATAWPNLPHAPKHVADAFHRLSEVVHSCRESLAGHADLEFEPDEDVQVLSAVLDGARVGAGELAEHLRAEAEHARGDITAAERELFDKTLTGDTRRRLAEKIRQAGDLVEAMNARLERVRTASNVAVRLVWQVDPELPAGTKAARELLLKDPVRLSESDRESLHEFFRDRIEAAKADNTAASWQEQLAQVFDYTAWHRFVVKLDRADGRGAQPLTKKLHGALSGGEKAIALHLPLFAAVAAHYQSVPEAPRLILLDEVFVGVDSANRGQVFALLASLDLDLVLTSDHEWGAYRELPGIAVHQLIGGDDGDDAVTTARFVWSGHEWHDEQT